MTTSNFSDSFKALTGHDPFPWQEKLYERFDGDIPRVVAVPTGLGKTSVIAVWLIALARGKNVPRRLVYVVNRRTVVDQTTNEAIKLRNNAKAIGIEGLAISTLRGQFADNREWSADPSRPAVICGTVDMIGSRLLFSGYGIGFKSRPLHAGFLGQDVLLVHDEAHLEPAFQKLITDIENEQTRERERNGELPWPKLRVMQLTATTRGNSDDTEKHETKGSEKPFELTDEEKNLPTQLPDPPTEPIHHVWRRLKAVKRLALHQVGDGKDDAAKKIAELALRHKTSDAAVLIFVRTLDDVKKICDRLTSKKDGVPEDHIQQLTGTMRGLERDRMADPRRPDASRVFARFLKPPKADAPASERWQTEPMPGTVYLVCTSAGEVGIDISADHMVCDLSTLESMVQRLGRVNRFGDGEAQIDVVYPVAFGRIDKRRQKTLELLRLLPSLGENLYDASPKALGELQQRLDLLPRKIQDAFAPEPTILPATDILFDAWALTTIKGKMPGRPEVAPYLHGIADDLAQTTIAWRAELDLLKDDSRPEAALKTIFAKHHIRPHESLTVRSDQAVQFLKEIAGPKACPELLKARIALIFARGLELTTVGALIDNPGPLNAEPTLVLPASFGGLDAKGMLSVPKPDNKKEGNKEDGVADDDSERQVAPPSLDIADAEGYERAKDMTPRMRVLIERSPDGWIARAMTGAAPLRDDWSLGQPPGHPTPLVNHIQKKSGLKVRLVQPIKWDEEDEPISALVCLSPPPKQQKPIEQPLERHVGMVYSEAERLVNSLLANDGVASAALCFAAKWHDEGKKALIWQRYIGGPNSNGELLGKSAEWRDPKRLSGYRHEFGSLLRIGDHQDEARLSLADTALDLAPEQQREALELALHLIAAHHGYGRPHFEHIIDPDFTAQQCEDAHVEVMRRFARLQRKYGRWGLAYLESLLRAADWAASAEAGIDAEVDDDDPADHQGNEA